MSDRSRLRRAALRNAWFEGKTCARCGTPEDLQVDHIDATTKDPRLRRNHPQSYGQVWNMPDELREIELEKCQPLCWPCHSEKTSTSGERPEGIHNGKATVAFDVVEEVRRVRAEEHLSYPKIAKRFDISIGTAHRWCTGKTRNSS